MSDPFRNILNIGGGGTQEVIVDPSRVTQEEFEAARAFVNVLWGTEGLAECLGPTWFLVHDPRFMALERLWASEKQGYAGVRRKGVSFVTALDTRTQISMIEDPELYSEMLAEGRHFLAACRARDIDPRTLQDRDATIRELIAQECPNYQRRDGSWNAAADKLGEMIKAGLVGLIADYAELAYSQDWVRMDTGEVVHKGEEIWDEESGMMVPTAAVEVDTIHKALVMRALIRTTALRLMKGFPGIKWEEFDTVKLTDEESDQICQLLFKVDYDKIYTILPEVMQVLKTAQAVPYETREARSLTTLSQRAQEFVAGMKNGTIEPIVTPIETNTDGTVDPSTLLVQISRNPYLAAVFQVAQNLAERGDEEANTLCGQLVKTGGSVDQWAQMEDFLQARGIHPKQDVLEGRQTFPDFELAKLRQGLEVVEIIIEGTEGDEHVALTSEQVEQTLEALRYVWNPNTAERLDIAARTTYTHGATRTPAALGAEIQEAIFRYDEEQRKRGLQVGATMEGSNA